MACEQAVSNRHESPVSIGLEPERTHAMIQNPSYHQPLIIASEPLWQDKHVCQIDNKDHNYNGSNEVL